MRIRWARFRLTEQLFIILSRKTLLPGDVSYRTPVPKPKAMKAYDDHRNLATRQENLDTTAGEGNGDFTLR
jgi:hypothetical protein